MPETDEFERQFARSVRRRGFLVWLTVAVVAGTPFAYLYARCHAIDKHNEEWRKQLDEDEAREEAYKNRPLLAAEAEALRAAIPRLEQELLDARERWHTATARAALAAMEPSAVKCNTGMTAPTIGAGESYAKYSSIDGNYFGHAPFELYKPDEEIAEPPFAQWIAEADAIAARVAAGQLSRSDYDVVERRVRGESLVAVMLNVYDEPTVAVSRAGLGVEGWVSGHWVGTAFMINPMQGVLCGGPIDVSNTPGLEVEYRTGVAGATEFTDASAAARGVLNRDLEVAVKRAFVAGMHVVTRPRP